MAANESMFTSDNEDWGTPACVLERVLRIDRIALDPCHGPAGKVQADTYYSQAEDGLSLPWRGGQGLVYMNPPYGRGIGDWVDKSIDEYTMGAEVVALVPARVETRWFYKYWAFAAAVCFWKGRLKFLGASDNSAPFPSAVVYLGDRVKRFDTAFRDAGIVLRL